MLSRGATYGLGFLASLLIARALGPDGRGAYHLVVTVATIAYYMVNLGTDQAQYRLWSTGAVPRELLRGSGLTLGFFLGLLGAGALLLFRILFGGPLLEQIPVGQMVIALSALPFMVHGLLLTGLATLRGDVTKINVALISGTVVYVAGVIALFFSHRLTVKATLVLWALNAITSWGVMVVGTSSGGAFLPLSLEVALRQVRLGLKYAPYILFTFLLLRIDVLFVAEMVGLTAVGLYSVAVLFPELVWIVTDSLAVPLAHKQANLEGGKATEVTIMAIRVILVLLAILTMLIALLAPWLIPFAYGDPFRAAGPVVWALLPGIVGMAVWRTLNPFLVRTQSPWVQPAIGGATLILNLLLNLVLISKWGVIGAAAASSISYLIGGVVAAQLFLRNTQHGFRDLVPTRDDVQIVSRYMRSTLVAARAVINNSSSTKGP